MKYVNFTVRDLIWRLAFISPRFSDSMWHTCEAVNLDSHPGRWY